MHDEDSDSDADESIYDDCSSGGSQSDQLSVLHE